MPSVVSNAAGITSPATCHTQSPGQPEIESKGTTSGSEPVAFSGVRPGEQPNSERRSQQRYLGGRCGAPTAASASTPTVDVCSQPMNRMSENVRSQFS